MSINAVAWALKIKTGSPTLKMVLIAVCNYADENGRCFPSTRRLAEDTELTKRSILSALKALEDGGFISRTANKRPDGSRGTDTIQIHSEMGGEGVSRGGESRSPRGERHSIEVVKDVHQGGEPASPLTTFEPSSEPSEEPSERVAAAPAMPRPPDKPAPNVERLEPPKKRQTRLPENFTLTPERLAFATKEGLSHEAASREFEKFCDHHGARGNTFLDWDRAWQNWVRKAADGFGRSGGSSSGGIRGEGPSLLRAYQRAASRFS